MKNITKGYEIIVWKIEGQKISVDTYIIRAKFINIYKGCNKKGYKNASVQTTRQMLR